MGRVWRDDRDERPENADKIIYSLLPIVLGLLIVLNLPPDNTGWFLVIGGAGILIGAAMCLRLLYGERS